MSRKAKNTKSILTNDVNYGQLSQNSKHFSLIFDKINIQITQELLKNHNITSSEISLKLKVPLSTIQRRRSTIERSGFLQHNYEIDPKKFGLRIADIMVSVSKGDCEEIAKEIVNQFRKNILEVTIRIGNPQINLIAKIAYRDSDEVFEIMHDIRRMEHVEYVEWSEVVKTVVKNDSGILKTIFE